MSADTRHHPNSASRRAHLQKIHELLVAQGQALITGEQWLNSLHAARRFHTYSPTNCLLILAQRPDATQVAGYRARLVPVAASRCDEAGPAHGPAVTGRDSS